MARPLISQAASEIRPSPTLAVTSVAAALKAQGHDVIAFAAGEPDLPTPLEVQEAGISAIRRGLGRYTAAAGLPELRAAAAARFQRAGLPYQTENVICSAGAKPALYEALYTVCEPDDEVLFPCPYWSSYPDIVRAVRAEPVAVPTRVDDGFQLDPAAVARAITQRSRVLMLNSPNNPTGAVYTKDRLEAVADILRRHEDVLVLSDDIYEPFTFGPEPFRNILHVAPDLFDRVITVNGLSKSHSMTGWRMGFVGAPKAIAHAMDCVQGQIAGNPPTITQHATIAALSAPLDPERAAAMGRRRVIMLDLLRQIPELICPEPHGAFYMFPNVRAFLGRVHRGTPIPTSAALAERLLDTVRVATLAGEIFGAPGHLRLSYACPEAQIREGVQRIADFLGELVRP